MVFSQLEWDITCSASRKYWPLLPGHNCGMQKYIFKRFEHRTMQSYAQRRLLVFQIFGQ